MTKRAGIESLLPRKIARGGDVSSGEAVGRVRGMPGDMTGRITVATPAADAQYDAVPVVCDGAVIAVVQTGRRRVAFHTIAGNLFVEIDQVGWKTGAVAPGIGGGIPGDGQLKKPVIIPI